MYNPIGLWNESPDTFLEKNISMSSYLSSLGSILRCVILRSHVEFELPWMN
uniref:Uncharacterized protein n=1 Tax=Arundo donax TaxID=35708 RepID=A0A0A9FYV5_ARUDO